MSDDATRHQLVTQADRLRQGRDRIRETTRVAHDIIEIGADTLATLDQQREQLLRARDALLDTDDDIARSRSTLRSMARHLLTLRCLVLLIVCVVVACIVCVVIFVVVPAAVPVTPSASPAPPPQYTQYRRE
jgi:vesicle transport through interaction with t-SNAREs protein 1